MSAKLSQSIIYRCLLDALGSKCFGLFTQVLVVWAGEMASPPVSKLIPSSRVPVHVVVPAQRTIGARFAPHPLIKTDAILQLDEDVALTAEEVRAFF